MTIPYTYIGRCFYFLRKTQPWSYNSRYCEAVDMRPMSVTDEELEFVVDRMLSDRGKMHIHNI